MRRDNQLLAPPCKLRGTTGNAVLELPTIGRFEIVGLAGGEYRVVAYGPSWAGGPLPAPGATDGDPPGLTISLADGETADVEMVVVRRSGTITGSRGGRNRSLGDGRVRQGSVAIESCACK